MVIFTNKRIVLPALGFLVFGDSVGCARRQEVGKASVENEPHQDLGGERAFTAVFCRLGDGFCALACGDYWARFQAPGLKRANFPITTISGSRCLSAAALSVLNLCWAGKRNGTEK